MADVQHSPEYYANSDIDWFCRINGVNVHVASMGRQLPSGIVETLPRLYEQVSEIEMAGWNRGEGVWYNEQLLRNWLGMEESQQMARYLYSFVVMARKGFYSFAPITPDATDENYYLMAKPSVYQDRVFEGMVSRNYDFFHIEQITPDTPVPLVWLLESERG